MPDHYNKPTGGMPVPTNIMEEARAIGAEQEQLQDQAMTAASPVGSFSMAPTNILIKEVNKILETLFQAEPVAAVEGDLQEFPLDLTTNLTMIDKAAQDARVDFEIDFDAITDDRAVQMLAGELAILANDKDFKRYLEDSTIDDQITMAQEEPEEMMMEEEEEEINEEEMDDLFASRM